MDIRCEIFAISEVDSLAATKIPTRKLVSVLELWIEDVDWTAEDMKTLKMVIVRESGACEML